MIGLSALPRKKEWREIVPYRVRSGAANYSGVWDAK
jgi:hypothetical protein